MCFFNAINNKIKFILQINFLLRSGEMTSALDGVQLIEYFIHLLRSSDLNKKKAILCTGLQPDQSCVVNAKSLYHKMVNYWIQMRVHTYGSTKISCTIKSIDITPEIKLPLSTTPLCKLVESLRIICKYNFIPTLVVMASVVISFYYSNVWGGYPITVVIGETETRKSTAIRAALPLFGCQKIGCYVKGTNALFLEQASRSTIAFGIEEALPSSKGKANKLN